MINTNGKWWRFPPCNLLIYWRAPRAATESILASWILTIPISGIFGSRIRSDAPIPTQRVKEDLPTFVGTADGFDRKFPHIAQSAPDPNQTLGPLNPRTLQNRPQIRIKPWDLWIPIQTPHPTRLSESQWCSNEPSHPLKYEFILFFTCRTPSTSPTNLYFFYRYFL
jgi:hypothetical protein